MAQASDYPVQLSIDYPKSSNRLTTFFRPILMIPILIVVIFVPLLVPATFLMVLFRRKYPRWWFDFNLEAFRFQARVNAYIELMQDAYPSTDEHQAVHLNVEYPGELNRWLPLIKWLLAIPHYIALVVLGMVAFILIIIAWFAILFTGSYPRSLFDFVLGYRRWNARVAAYAFMLATDKYPPVPAEPMTADPDASADLTFEQAMTRLDDTVRALEAGDLPLDEAVRLYERGMKLARLSSEMLAAAELKVTQIQTAYGEQMRLPAQDVEARP